MQAAPLDGICYASGGREREKSCNFVAEENALISTERLKVNVFADDIKFPYKNAMLYFKESIT